MTATALTIDCPECSGTVLIPGSVTVSEILECDECLVELEVLETTPIEVALAPEVEEDWGE
ncbi:hypothetical protein GCM10028784_20480 [Myceligenerans cantabricum]